MAQTTPDSDAAREVAERIDLETLADELTGRGSGLRKSKPDADGLTQYVWRHARSQGGYDTSMPVTASWWLQDWLDAEGIDASVSGVMDEDGKAITSLLEDLVDAVLMKLGEQTGVAAERWAQVGVVDANGGA